MNRKERRQKAKAAKKSGLKVNHHGILAEQLAQQGKIEEAIVAYQQALKADRKFVMGHYNLGVLYGSQGRPGDAIQSYQRAITLNPDYAEAHYSLGNALKEQNNVVEAIASFQKAITLKPDYMEAHINLGNILKEQNYLDEAADCYRNALVLDPDYAEAHNNLGNILREQNNLNGAVESYRNSLAINPSYAEGYYNLGNALQEQGHVDGAVEQFAKALSHKPEAAVWRIRKATLLPVIPYSEEDIMSRRKNLVQDIQKLQKQNLVLEDPTIVGAANFYLSYHNQDNKNIMEEITKLYSQACPHLTYEATHCESTHSGQERRLRIGFLSAYFWEHTIGKLMRGIIENISHDLFEVIVFRLPGIRDEMSEALEGAADKVVQLYKTLKTDRTVIGEEELDILFYPDIGMDPYTYFLSFARLAPVQAITWGHPDTTGITNIDYFISSNLLEKTGSEDHYTERLIKLSLLPTYYVRPQAPEKIHQRVDFGVAEKSTLYVCPQTLFKFHPCFDAIIGELLKTDPDGYLVLIDDGKGGCGNDLMSQRVGRSHPDVVDRVIFVPRMNNKKFLSLLMLADALLDIPTFSGGNSSQEAFAMGAPIVTWPGDFMRSRVTAGCYKQMGLSDLIAASAVEYVTLAFKLAHDKDFKNRMQEDINANSYKLFERMEVVRELEAFFVEACATPKQI
jgi:predicted O-linked N-acetylglucosamine transferase (SPINDLY family)